MALVADLGGKYRATKGWGLPHHRPREGVKGKDFGIGQIPFPAVSSVRPYNGTMALPILQAGSTLALCPGWGVGVGGLGAR